MSTALHLAVMARKKDAITKALKNKKQPICVDVIGDLSGFTPLHTACELGFLDIVQTLLKHKASISALTSENETPLVLAARMGHWDVVEFLLKHGADRMLFLFSSSSLFFLSLIFLFSSLLLFLVLFFLLSSKQITQ